LDVLSLFNGSDIRNLKHAILNRFLHSFYRTGNLASLGAFILACTIVLLALGGLIIPKPETPEPTEQMSTLNGLNLKYSDKSETRYFLKSIINNDGYLCLGTSESTHLKHGNYQDFLNNDPELTVRFSRLPGSGRTGGVHVPWLLNQHDLLDSLKFIYLINPVYWRKGLNQISLAYSNRYHNPVTCDIDNETIIDLEPALYSIRTYLDKLPFIQSVQMHIEYWLRKMRIAFFNDLRIHLGFKAFGEDFTYISKAKRKLDSYNHFGQVNTSEVDTVWNALHSYPARTSSQEIDESSDYRYEELKAFIAFCKHTGIDATFILGPYNERFMTKSRPKSVEPFKETTDRIRGILDAEGVTYVDATDISNTAGAFNDYQHHSSYGAYLIYQKLKPLIK
jgi:hypothetical protein